MPKSKNYLHAVRHLERIVSRYNGLKWGYFNPHKPMWEQRHYNQFIRLILTLDRYGIKPEEFIQFCPYEKGRFFPSFFTAQKVHDAIAQHGKFNQRKRSMEDNSKERDFQFLKEMAESTGLCVIYLINFFWGDLHPETQEVLVRFHNDYFLSATL